tara:strand:+ start:2868 stop:3785 length:918 start_codon:yes stop_codon:yes gene_type:complete
MSSPLRRSRRLNPVSQENQPVPQWFFAAFTGDRSGSMSSMESAPANGLYEWVAEMKESAIKNNQNGFISVSTFDDISKLVFDNVNVKTVQFTKDDARVEMEPRGCTCLFDTAIEDIDRLMERVETFKNSLPKEIKQLNPKISTTWACCTDGLDNASTEYTREDFRNKVIEARKKGVKCFFIAANQDAITTGNAYGFSDRNSLSFSANRHNASSAFRSVSLNMSRATTGSSDVEFTQDMREASIDPSDVSLHQTLPQIPRQPYNLRSLPTAQEYTDPLNQTIRPPRNRRVSRMLRPRMNGRRLVFN